MSRQPICPRCLHYIPNDLHPGAYPGFMSAVADAEICSACGLHEAWLPVVFRPLPSSSRWPISVPWDVTTPLTHFRVLEHLGIRDSHAAEKQRELDSQEAEVRRKHGSPPHLDPPDGDVGPRASLA